MKEKAKKVFDFIFSWAAKIIILAVIIYIVFNIGRSIWKNWQVNQTIKNSEDSIKALEDKNSYLKNQLAYMQTDVFKELEARSRLGLKKPDEKMILVPENASNTKTPTPRNNSGNEISAENLPNPNKWWKYIVGK
jgi:cell division protein FtsB